MAYCTYDHVGTLLELTFTDDSKPSSTKVTEIIDMIASEINLVLISRGISVPVAGTDFYKILTLNNAYGAAGVVGLTYLSNVDGVDDKQGAYYKKEYKDFIALLKSEPDLFKTMIKNVTASTNVTDGYTEEDVIEDRIGDDWES